MAFDFSDDLTPDFGGIPEIAIDAAHESGHSFGLEHTDNPLDIMYSVATPDLDHRRPLPTRASPPETTRPTTPPARSASRCPGRGTALDNVRCSTTALGANPNPGDTQAADV